MAVRFWVYANGGAVRLTLAPGQSLEHVEGGAHAEGWYREGCQWMLSPDGLTVEREYWTDGQDCDGRLSTDGEDVTPVADLAAGYRDDGEGVTYPVWGSGRTSQRDEHAEAAGY